LCCFAVGTGDGNETIKLFRGGMPLRRHWAHFRYYDCSFTGSEAVDYLHELLRKNYNFGPEVTRYQTLQLLRKFLKAHVIEDIKGRHGTEDFEDSGHLYRYCIKPNFCLIWFPLFAQTSDLCNKRHSVAIGDVHECKLILRKEVTPKQVDHIWKSMTVAQYVNMETFTDMPYWVISAMKCLANLTRVPGFERDVLKTVTVLLSCLFFAGLLQDQEVATEALRLLLRLMARVCQNPHLPPLNDTIPTRTLVHAIIKNHHFSHCVLSSVDDMDLDELLSTTNCQVEEHMSHLRRVQVITPVTVRENTPLYQYAGSDTDFSSSPAFCKHISRVDSEEQKVIGTRTPLQELLERFFLSLLQFEKSYPEVYQHRFPTEESKAAVIPEKTPRIKPHLMFFNLKKPFQPFQRSWSFRA
uniref:DEP domain-containing protein n=1 Tax=Sphaeramia orbicularis TaxID=375764 RepID=A0A673A416_9TELE